MKKRTLFSAFVLLLGALLLPFGSRAQGPIPFTIANTSPFADTDLYVAIVGLDNAGNHIWVNARNSQVLPMASSYNTVLGPTYNGNTGPGGNSRYAACFTRLSEIPNKTFTLPQIQGCRVFISRGQQLYLYFFGSSGAPSGYAGPNGQNPNDVNRDILYEIIELTNNQFGFFGNTTRVDSYKYPMGLELFGVGYQKRTGELKTAAEIVAAYKANVPAEFQGTVNNATGEITFPAKTPAFYDGTNGTTPGPYANYFKSYIDAIWAKYVNVDLIFNAGNAGVFRGRVSGERLTVVGQSGAFAGRTGVITRRPTTQEAFEGKGVLATRVGDGDCDLVVQAQMTAAINRHVVNTTAANPGLQDWYNVPSFYQTAPMNYYARFWHLPGISVDNLSYGFAYDDVADQSATLQTPRPTRVIATFGGYAGQAAATPKAIPGRIEAEDFATQVGTDTEPTTDTGGGRNVDYFETNDYLDYSVNVASAGAYTVGFRVASANGGATLQLRNSGGAVLGSINVGNTGGWQSWQTINATVNLPAGVQTLRLFAAASTGCNVNWLNFATAGAAAFSRQLEAEAANVNNGMVVEACTDAGGGQNMGFIDAGDYLVWNGINFPTSGSYLIEYRVASGAAGGTISSDLNAGATQLGNTTVSGTGGWQNWTTVSRTVTINAGTYNFGVYAQTGGYNLNWVRITRQGAARMASPTTASAKPSSAQVLELYPNPVAERLNLSLAPEFAGEQLQILSVEGRVVWRGTYTGEALNVAALKPGLYTLVVQTKAAGKLVSRFSKQ